MNEITRKATNALVATVDFFSGALAAEAQAGEEKQRQLDALAGQLRSESNRSMDLENMLEDADKELARVREVLTAEQASRMSAVRRAEVAEAEVERLSKFA